MSPSASPMFTVFSPQLLPEESPLFPLYERPCPSWEYLTLKHKIPPTLSGMNKLDKMGIAYAYETREVVESELLLAEKRYLQQLIVARAFYLRLVKTKDKLLQINHNLRMMVDVAQKDVSSEENPSLRISQTAPWYKRLDDIDI